MVWLTPEMGRLFQQGAAERRGFAPLVLLDEPLASLDAERCSPLFVILAAGTGQVLLTGTEAEPCRPLASQAAVLHAGAGRLVGQPALYATPLSDL